MLVESEPPHTVWASQPLCLRRALPLHISKISALTTSHRSRGTQSYICIRPRGVPAKYVGEMCLASSEILRGHKTMSCRDSSARVIQQAPPGLGGETKDANLRCLFPTLDIRARADARDGVRQDGGPLKRHHDHPAIRLRSRHRITAVQNNLIAPSPLQRCFPTAP
jgi:hypothetical protein